MRILLFCLLFCAFAIDPNPLPGWKEHPLPGEAEVDKLNFSHDEWHVYLEKGTLKVAPDSSDWLTGTRPPFDPDTIGVKQGTQIPRMGCINPVCSLPVTGGWLLGTDHGEWGGCLRFADSSGHDISTVMNGHFKNILAVNGRVFAIDGLSHMGYSHGRIIELERVNGKWQQKTEWP